MKSLLIINQEQFGYQTDYLNYVTHLTKSFEVTYLCWDYDRPKISGNDARVIYVSRRGHLLKRNLRFIQAVTSIIKDQRFDHVFMHYFRGVSMVRILCGIQATQFVLDIRTASVSPSSWRRAFYNTGLRAESALFRRICVISEGVRDLLKLDRNAYILPLGANPVYVSRQPGQKMSLLYVGTLTDRRISDTVEAFASFLKLNPHADAHYFIVGGTENEVNELRKQAHSLNIESKVSLEGYVHHSLLEKYYTICNVGMSYLPITPYFTFQPPTKTFEYLLAGLPVIATGTAEHVKIVNKRNGIIIQDNPKSLAEGLASMYHQVETFTEEDIRASAADHTWSIIVENMRIRLFNK